MKPRKHENSLNIFGEFSDAQLEERYLNCEMESSLRFIRPVALFLGILNTLFLIPDYFFIHNTDHVPGIFVIRILFFLSLIIFYIFIHKVKNPFAITYIISAIEGVFIFIFLYVLYQYGNPDFLIQSLGVIVFIIVVFMVPNRWLNMVFISLLLYLGFIIMSIYYIPAIEIAHLSAGLVYIFIVLILSGITAYRNQFYKRVQYVYSNDLLRAATVDPLTKAYNRMKLEEELLHHLHGYKVNKVPLSLVMFDFDHFKEINDCHGHIFGDYIIVEAIALIRDHIRGTDILARWGGDEFILLLPNTNIEQAIDLCWRISEKLAVHPFKKSVQITCSFGAAEMLPEDDINSLLSRADQMLYLSKHSGKNMVNGLGKS